MAKLKGTLETQSFPRNQIFLGVHRFSAVFIDFPRILDFHSIVVVSCMFIDFPMILSFLFLFEASLFLFQFLLSVSVVCLFRIDIVSMTTDSTGVTGFGSYAMGKTARINRDSPQAQI